MSVLVRTHHINSIMKWLDMKLIFIETTITGEKIGKKITDEKIFLFIWKKDFFAFIVSKNGIQQKLIFVPDYKNNNIRICLDNVIYTVYFFFIIFIFTFVNIAF